MKKITLIIFIFSIIILQVDLFSAELEYKGDVNYERWGFKNEAAGANQTNYNNTLEMTFEGLIKTDFFSILAAPRVKEDFQVRSRNRLLFDEAWIDFTLPNIEFRAGIQQFTWGMVESQKITDVLNQKDYQDDFFDPDKFGELSARLRLAFFEGTDFTFYYLTNFKETSFPTTEDRYNFYNGQADISDSSVYGSGRKKWMPQYAARIRTTISTVDLSLSYFHGYNRFPIIDFMTGIPYYYIIDQGGLEFTWVIGKLIVKFEGIYKNSSGTDETRINKSLIPDPYYAYVGGIEYSFSRIIENSDLSIFIEYIGDSDRGEDTVEYRLFQNNIFMGFRYSLNDINSKELTVGATIDLARPKDIIYMAELSGRFKEVFTYAVNIDGVSSSKNSRLEAFKEELRLKLKVSYNYSSE